MENARKFLGTRSVCKDWNYCAGMPLGAEIEFQPLRLIYRITLICNSRTACLMVCRNRQEGIRMLIYLFNKSLESAVELLHLLNHPLRIVVVAVPVYNCTLNHKEETIGSIL